MQNQKDLQAINTIGRILECAVCVNWKDFAGTSSPTAMRFQYRIGPYQLLKHLKLWLSTSRGHWKLVCEYWMEADTKHPSGITFSRNYSSAGLTCMLDAITHHPGEFALDRGDMLDRLVQIPCPDDTQLAAARHQLTRVLERMTVQNGNGNITALMRSAADHPELPGHSPTAGNN